MDNLKSEQELSYPSDELITPLASDEMCGKTDDLNWSHRPSLQAPDMKHDQGGWDIITQWTGISLLSK